MKKTIASLAASALLAALGSGPAFANPSPAAAPVIAPAPAAPVQTAAAASFFVQAGKPEAATRSVEGTTEKTIIIPYTILPYGVTFKLDAFFGRPMVNPAAGKLAFYKPVGGGPGISLTMQTMKGAQPGAVLAALNKEFAAKGYKRTGKTYVGGKAGLAGVQVSFASRTAYAGYTFYELKDAVLVVRHAYPFDAGDGAGSMLGAMRATLRADG